MRKRRKGEYSELIFSALSCGGACLFGFLVVLVLDKAGAIAFNMPHGILFFAFLFCCVFAINFSLCFFGFKKRKASLKSIYDAVAKISSGDYEICLGDISGEYKDAANALETVALALKRSEETKNDFINDFSHELKTPIVSIRGFAKLIAKGEITKEEQDEYLGIIVSESDRLIDLTAGTLMLDRLANNRLDVTLGELDLSEMLRKCILLLQSAWEKKNIEIEADVGDCKIVSNEELLSRLFINIIDNAVKFTPENGKVSVFLEERGKEVMVIVRDNGVGMDEETRHRMFDKYYRAEKSRTTHGNGLGLATVKRIAELLDLKIETESEIGKGTTFRIIYSKRR